MRARTRDLTTISPQSRHNLPAISHGSPAISPRSHYNLAAISPDLSRSRASLRPLTTDNATECDGVLVLLLENYRCGGPTNPLLIPHHTLLLPTIAAVDLPTPLLLHSLTTFVLLFTPHYLLQACWKRGRRWTTIHACCRYVVRLVVLHPKMPQT